MSAVTGVGGTDLSQWLQQLTGNTQTSTTTAAQDPSAAAADPTTDPTAEAPKEAGGHHHHHHGFAQKIESSVTSALQNAAPGSDPNQTIKDAITQALQGNSNDPNNPNATTPGTPADPTAASATPTSSQTAFDQLLQSYGVNPQQFQQDLQSSLASNAPNGSQGNVNFAQLFQSFPQGSLIQATG